MTGHFSHGRARRPLSGRVGPSFVVGVLALAVTLAGCGGTRVSDEAIEQAAGAARVQQVPAAIDSTAGSPRAGAGAVSGPAGDSAVPAAPTKAGAGAGTPARRSADVTNSAAEAAAPTAKKPESAASGGQPPSGGTPVVAGARTGTPIKLGVVGTFSGPVGGLVKDTVTGIRVWGQAVNSAGGVNGHPVEILVGDDGGDPARFNSTAQQFVEQQGVLAFLYTTLGFAPNGNNRYLDSKKLYTFGMEGGLEVPYTNPFVLSATPTGLTFGDGLILAFGKAINASGGVKLASFACSDFGLCDNFDQRWPKKEVLDKAGFTLVARGRPSLTQPDYTSQCLAAKQAGAEAIIIALDGSAIRRFASDCARQQYRPRFATSDLVVTRDVPGDKNLDGLIIGTKMASFPDTRAPGLKEAHAAFARYAPGQAVTGGMANGWLIGEFFAQAAQALPANPTTKDLEDGLYRIRSNDLKGMTFPITMTRGQPMARQLCYGIAVVRGGQFAPGPGRPLLCEKRGAPLADLSDYSITRAVRA